MRKKDIPNQKKAYKNLAKRLNKYSKKVLAIYSVLAKEASNIAVSCDFNGDGEFSLANYPKTERKIDELLKYYSTNMETLVYDNISKEWEASNALQDLLAQRVIRSYKHQIGGNTQKRLFEHNNAALNAFKERKVKGLNLSERIWNQEPTVKENLEKALATGIEKGISAVKLSKRVSLYLNDYPKLAKDYKKKFGKAINITACEYRSIRLARNEINMAYRTAEQERWAKMDYIKAKEIKTSSNLSHKKDMCDLLAGIYPKNFSWTGWHVNCMCYCIPIIMSEEEYWGGYQPRKEMPSEFTDWVNNNKDKVKQSSYIVQYARAEKMKITNIVSKNKPLSLNELVNQTLQQKFREELTKEGNTARSLYLHNGGSEYIVRRGFFNETKSNNIHNKRLRETIEIATKIDEWFPTATFVRIEDGIHHKFKFEVFRANYKGKTIECKAKVTEGKILYTMRLL